MQKHNLGAVIALLGTLCTLILLFYFSGQSGTDSNAVSGSFIDAILQWLNWQPDAVQWKWLHYFLRKGAHLSLFFALGFCLYRLCQLLFSHAFAWTLGIGFCIAGCNEFHQLLVGTRTASFEDVLLDTAGVLLGCLAHRAGARIMQKWQK